MKLLVLPLLLMSVVTSCGSRSDQLTSTQDRKTDDVTYYRSITDGKYTIVIGDDVYIEQDSVWVIISNDTLSFLKK